MFRRGDVAGRFGLERAATDEHLLDAESHGWVRRTEFAGRSGWSITDRGRTENERQLALELDAAGARRSPPRCTPASCR